MKRIIYGVGCFLIALFFTVGFLITYQLTDLKDRIYALEETNASAKQQVSVPAVNYKNKTFVLEHYQDGILQRSPSSFILTAQTRWFSVRRKLLQKTQAISFRLRRDISLYTKILKIRFLNIPTFLWNPCQKSCKVKCCWESRLKPLMSFIIFWRIIPAKIHQNPLLDL